MKNPIEILAVSKSGALFEGPAWDARSEHLFWVDIARRYLYRWKVRLNSLSRWRTPERCSAVIPLTTTDLQFLVPGERKIWLFDSDSGEFTSWIGLTEEPENNRCNDAKCDPTGALWVGSMDLEEQTITGAHWRVHAHRQADRVRTGVGIANTWCWDEKRQVVYWADSKAGNIYVSEYILIDGRIEVSNKADVFVGNSDAPGVPDGSAIDTEGNIWNARWGSGLVIGFSPDGREISRLSTEWKYPTSCAFYGPGLSRLAITCASPAYVDTRSQEMTDQRTSSAALISIKTGSQGAQVALFGDCGNQT